MLALIDFLCEHGLMLVGGSTMLLAAGTLAAALMRSPAHRQRIAECSVAAAMVWAVLACVPMRRVNVWAEPKPTIVREIAPAIAPERRPAAEDLIIPREEISPEVIAVPNAEPAPTLATPLPNDAATKVADPAPVAPLQAPRAFRWQRAAAWGFVAGAAAIAGWLLAGGMILRRMVRRGDTPEPWLAELLAGMPEARQTRPRLVVSRELTRPVSFGLWRASIVLPAGLAGPAKRQCVRQVLLHELAHLCRGDAWGNLVLNLGMVVLYFHPLYWWLRGQAGLSRELVADDWAAQQSDRQTYVQELVALARMDGGGCLQAAATIGILGSTSQFYRRMHMLLGRQTVLATRCSQLWRIVMTAGWSLAVITAAALLGVSPAGAQDTSAGTRAVAAPGGGAPVAAPVAVPAPERMAAAREEESKVGELTTSVSVQNYVKARELDRLTEAEFKLSTAARDAQKTYDRLTSLVKKGGHLPEIDKAVEADASVSGFVRDISQLQIQCSVAADQYSKDHPNVKKIERLLDLNRAQLDARREELRAKSTSELLESAKARVNETQADLDAVERRLDLLRHDLEIKAAEERQVARAWAARAHAAANGEPGPGNPGGLPVVPPVAVPNRGMVPPGDAAGRPAPVPGAGMPVPAPAGAKLVPGAAARPVPVAVPAAAGGVQLDLVNLANSAVSAVGTLHVAESDLARIKQMADAHTVSQQELSHAESDFQTARRRIELLRGIARVALAAAEHDHKTADVEMLKLIVGSME